MKRGEATRALHAALPAPLCEAADDFANHLAQVQNRSTHTVRAYVADVISLLDHAVRAGARTPADLTLAQIRSWLARQRTTGAARSTLARRSAAARTFSAWAHRDGRLPVDVAAGLASPRAHRELPAVLPVDQAAALLETAPAAPRGQPTDDVPPGAADPVRLRDQLLLELLYATGVRVSEACGLNVADVDPGRRPRRPVVGRRGAPRR